jgi:hypothetical protein
MQTVHNNKGRAWRQDNYCYGLDHQGIGVHAKREGRRKIFFSSSHHPVWFCSPSGLLPNDSRGAFPGGKTAEAWSYISNHPYIFMVWCLIK